MTSHRLAAALGAALLLLLASAATAAGQCYKADQQVNIRSKPDICSNSVGSIQGGDIIQVTGTPQRVSYEWAQAQIVTGMLANGQGFVDLERMSQTACPPGGGGGTCYKADQAMPVQSKPDPCSGPKGQLAAGDVVKAQGSTRQSYNWQQGTVLTGGQKGTTGYFNLDAMSPSACPIAPGGACKNPGEQCATVNECCQAPGVSCKSPPGGGAKVCQGAVVPTFAPGGTGTGTGGGGDTGGTGGTTTQGGCVNPGFQCTMDSDCCQAPGGVSCRSAFAGAPTTCIGAAVATAATP